MVLSLRVLSGVLTLLTLCLGLSGTALRRHATLSQPLAGTSATAAQTNSQHAAKLVTRATSEDGMDLDSASQQIAATGTTKAYAEVNGLRMYYEMKGSGKPLVMLHGAFGWATDYPILAKGRRVIAVELQGHGHTGDINRPLSFEQMADDTAALLKYLKIERADVFGYSMGGTVALALAIRHPELVDKVAINGSHFRPMESAYEPEAFRQFQSLPADFAPPMLKEPYDKVAPDPSQWPVLVAKLKQMELGFKGFSREDMQAIKAPVLITLGDRDGVRPEHAVEMFRLIPNAELAVFPGGDHFLIWTDPETVLSPVAAFLDDHPESTQ
jgi:pimeloyl-ACP methyl ester carboxylesterase